MRVSRSTRKNKRVSSFFNCSFFYLSYLLIYFMETASHSDGPNVSAVA